MTKKNKNKIEKNEKDSFFRRNCIEITSSLIAMLALGLTIYQGIQTRYHNRLSVMPHLQFEHHTSELTNYYSIIARNRGLGPARITGIEINVGREFFRFRGPIDYETIIKSLRTQKIADIDGSKMDFRSFSPNIYIDKGELVELIKLTSSAPRKSIEQFFDLSKNIDFLFCYSSIYGDQFYASRKTGISNEDSCRFDDTFSIFGHKLRWSKNFPPIDTKETHGY